MTTATFAARGLVLALGVAAAALSGASFVGRPTPPSVVAAADRIGRGEGFGRERIASLSDHAAASIGQTCDPSFLIAAALVQARGAEDAIGAADLAGIDRHLDQTERSSRRLIACVPTQALGWLGLFWIEVYRGGFRDALLPLLAASYRAGTKEIWIQARRSPLAMNVYMRLPPDLQRLAIDEYVGLVGLHQLRLVVEVYRRVDDETRAIIDSRMNAIPIQARTYFAREISRAGLPIDLPKVLGLPDRPWNRN